MASDDLRARIDAAIRPNMLFGLQDAELYDEPGRQRINEWADWISKTVAGLLQPELDRLQALNDDAWGSVWLHGKWSWLTKCMTTEEREHAADCVARWSARLAEIDGDLDRGEPEGLRWWREPEQCCVCGSTTVTYHNYHQQPFCAPCADGQPPTTKE